MKKIVLSLICAGSAVVAFADGTNQLADEQSRISYAIGMNMGMGLKQNSVDLDTATFMRGLTDAQSGQTLLTEQEMREVLGKFQASLHAKQQQRQAEMGAKAKADGDAFLAMNKTQPGVITLPDGLQYQVVTNGTGTMPTADDTVTVNYRGTFIDGKEFDSSFKRGEPASFRVGGVIPGWTEALEKMPVGSRWKLFIPSDLAYGEHGNRAIPPNSVLVFDVELLSMKANTPPPSMTPAAPLTSDIIKVPSAEELKNGAKIETIKAEDVQKLQTNSAAK